jgi:hypothetical protein
MPTLKAPNQVLFLVSLILAIVAWVSAFAGIPRLGEHPIILVTLAFVVLAFGCSRAVTVASQALLTHAAAATGVRLKNLVQCVLLGLVGLTLVCLYKPRWWPPSWYLEHEHKFNVAVIILYLVGGLAMGLLFWWARHRANTESRN